MAKEKETVETIGLSNLAGLDGIDLSEGYICDVETGICGPIDEEEAVKNEATEEKKNENNHVV